MENSLISFGELTAKDPLSEHGSMPGTEVVKEGWYF